MSTTICIVRTSDDSIVTEEERASFKERWNKVTDMVVNYSKLNEKKVHTRGLHVALDGEKPSMLKTSSGVTYLGNGKAVKYV